MLKNETGVTMDSVNLDLLQKLQRSEDGLQILILGPSSLLLVNHQWKIRVHFTCFVRGEMDRCTEEATSCGICANDYRCEEKRGSAWYQQGVPN